MIESKVCTKCLTRKLWKTNKTGICCYCEPKRGKQIVFKQCKYCSDKIRENNQSMACNTCRKKYINKEQVKMRRQKLEITNEPTLDNHSKCDKCNKTFLKGSFCLPCKREKEDNYKEL